MIAGILQKITPAKKLMIRINENTFMHIKKRCEALAKYKSIQGCKLPTWSFVNDDGEDMFFLMVKLDSYDVQNLSKFERMRRSDVLIDGTLKAYSFIPEGETEQCTGINWVLTQIKKKLIPIPPSVSPCNSEETYADIAERVWKQEEHRKLKAADGLMADSIVNMNGEFDDMITKKIQQRLARAQSVVLPDGPPVLERQNGEIGKAMAFPVPLKPADE